MTKEEKTKALLDATAGIREEYIEEAAAPQLRKRPLWTKLAAAAAVLVILVGLAVQLWPATPDATPVPFFVIQAYAADGSAATLSKVGDTSKLQTGTSDLFPGKEVYILDVLFADAAGNRLDLTGSDFLCFHRGKNLQPGQSDEQISISWVEVDGLSGYRIVGWCEDFDLLDITIRDTDNRILHQKELRIDFDGQYHVNVLFSYNYEPHLTTEQLITKLFDSGQTYSSLMLASSPSAAYSFLRGYGGFVELEQREDAASLLLERWVRQMEEDPKNWASVQGSGLIGLVLSQTPHWRNLTEEELALIADYGVSRGYPEPEENYYFPGHRIFVYELELEEHEPRGCVLEISYCGKTIRSGEWHANDEHFNIRNIFWSELLPEDVCAWSIVGWFDEPTKITLSVYDGEELIRQEVLLIIPSEDRYDEYQIDILETTS